MASKTRLSKQTRLCMKAAIDRSESFYPWARKMLQDEKLLRDVVGMVLAVGDPDSDAAEDAVFAVVNEARQDQENGVDKAAAGLSAIAMVVEKQISLQDPPTERLLSLLRQYAAADAKAPDCLIEAIRHKSDNEHGVDEGDFAAMMAEMLSEADDDPYSFWSRFSETLPLADAEHKPGLIDEILGSANPDLGVRLAMYWVLDGEHAIAIAAAESLLGFARSKHLQGSDCAMLVFLRAVIPHDSTRAFLDQTIRTARLAAPQAAPSAPAATITGILATIPDGVGAQSLMVSMRQGRHHRTAAILLKTGFGIRDSFIVPHDSVHEKRQFIAGFEQMDPVALAPELARELVCAALADGLSAGRSPSAGIVDIIEQTGWFDLRPQARTVDDFLALAGLSGGGEAKRTSRRTGSLEVCFDLFVKYPCMESWFEDDEAITGPLAANPDQSDDDQFVLVLKALQKRREKWALQTARTAFTLSGDAKRRKDAMLLASYARSLLAGDPIEDCPLMQVVANQTLDAWNGAGDEEEGGPFAQLPEGDKPDLETALGLVDSTMSADGVLGYLTAIVVTPKLIPAAAWVQGLISTCTIDPDSEPDLLQFLDAIAATYNSIRESIFSGTDLLSDEFSRGERIFAWASGFEQIRQLDKNPWPRPTKSDRALLQIIKDLAAAQMTEPPPLGLINSWLASRFLRSNAS